MSKDERLRKLFLFTEELPFSYWRNIRDKEEDAKVPVLSQKERRELKKEGMPSTPYWRSSDELFEEINAKIKETKKKLGIDSLNKLVKGLKTSKIGFKNDTPSKNRQLQLFIDYDNPKDERYETEKEKQKQAIDYYIRNNYFYLGDEDKLFLDERGRYTTASFEEFKRINEVRKKYKDEEIAKGIEFPPTSDEEEEFYNLKELSKTPTLTKTDVGGGALLVAAPAPETNPSLRGAGKATTEIPAGIVSEKVATIEETLPSPAELTRQKSAEKRLGVLMGQTTPRGTGGEDINQNNDANNFAQQTTAPSDTTPPPPTPPPTPSGIPAETIQLLRDADELIGRGLGEDEGSGLEGEANKKPAVSMEITKDRINIGQKIDDIPTETILDKIPESRFSSQFKTIKQLNDDIKYFIKNFGNVVGKDLIKQYNEADKTNLLLIRRLHGLIGGKLKTDKQKEKKVGIIIDADEYINQKINDALLNRGVSMNVPDGVRTNLESQSDKQDKSIGNFDVRKAREGGLLAVRREPVYRYIPSNNEKMNKPIDSRKQIKNGGLRMLPTQRRDLATTARKQVRDDPFARKHNPRKIICLY